MAEIVPCLRQTSLCYFWAQRICLPHPIHLRMSVFMVLGLECLPGPEVNTDKRDPECLGC